MHNCAQDQWRNSGGRKGATNMQPSDPSIPYAITRRYGVVRCRTAGGSLRYHEYFLSKGGWQSPRRLFHTLPPRKRRAVRK